jgi:glycosyltransferase involved in cell wall biosynthesis
LNIWKELKLDANLVICGNIDPIIQELFQEELKDTRIIKTGFVYNVSDFYSSADIFILPTLEEGSPMVTYEAMAHGLPVILSEMGAGPIARNEIDGFIIDPHNSSEFKNALIRLLTDTKLRKDMGINAYNRAQEFTWGKVGLKRANILSEKLSLN